MDEDNARASFDIAQFALDVVQLVTMADRGSGGEFARPVDFRLVGDEDNRGDALGMHLTHHMLRRERAVDFLPAGHGDRIVVENFVGHVDARRDALADREKA